MLYGNVKKIKIIGLKNTGCDNNKIDRTNLNQEREKYSYMQSKINKSHIYGYCYKYKQLNIL